MENLNIGEIAFERWISAPTVVNGFYDDSYNSISEHPQYNIARNWHKF